MKSNIKTYLAKRLIERQYETYDKPKRGTTHSGWNTVFCFKIVEVILDELIKINALDHKYVTNSTQKDKVCAESNTGEE